MPLDASQPYPIRPRLKDKQSYLGQRPYFITINAHKKQKLFIHENIVNSLIKYLKYICEKDNFDVMTYCFMPNHLHLVLFGKDDKSDLCKFVKDFKQITGYNYKQTFKNNLWSLSFHDRVLRKEQDIKKLCRYVLKNPVRAGLVKSVLDYSYSGSFVWRLEDLVQSDPFLDYIDEEEEDLRVTGQN
ncbi:transposase [Patescibacteria group bacterium]|nr:transposase [Patescibacteria group bacterium]